MRPRIPKGEIVSPSFLPLTAIGIVILCRSKISSPEVFVFCIRLMISPGCLKFQIPIFLKDISVLYQVFGLEFQMIMVCRVGGVSLF